MRKNNAIFKIEKVIAEAKPEEQRKFLAILPRLLKVKIDDLMWLKLSEPSFDFWKNQEDEVYDSL